MTLRVAQFFLKIAHLSSSMGPRGPRACGLRPRLWLLASQKKKTRQKQKQKPRLESELIRIHRSDALTTNLLGPVYGRSLLRFPSGTQTFLCSTLVACWLLFLYYFMSEPKICYISIFIRKHTLANISVLFKNIPQGN